MISNRIKLLQADLACPLLIKKKENLLYLTGRSFLHGYLLVLPLSTKHLALSTSIVFLGDGLEKVEGLHSDFLKNVGMYVPRDQVLEVYGDFTYAEVKYIKYKNPKLKVKVVIKHDPVDNLRMVKDEQEIRLVKKSMEIVEKVFVDVKKQLGRGGSRSSRTWTEIELAEFIKARGLKYGADNISFPPIVASGPNAAVPHHVPGNKKLKAGESIILDFGFKYKNYCSDFTRTVFLKSAPKKLASAYNQVEKAYWGAIGFINECNPLIGSAARIGKCYTSNGPLTENRKTIRAAAPYTDYRMGVSAEDVYQKSVSILAEKKLDKYFIHSLGHGTGLEIHEKPNLSPKSKDVLKKGMVFSIEPGVYLPKTGGIRIEDLVYLSRGRSRSGHALRGLDFEAKRFINVSTKLEDNILK